MRHIIYYSSTAPTTGNQINKDDLMSSGRLDIAIHTVISSFFLSHEMRSDVTLHLVFDGPNDPTKHLIFKPVFSSKENPNKIYLNKKDVSQIIKKMLYKYVPEKCTEVFPGYFIEKKALNVLLKELTDSGKKIYVLDKSGQDIRETEMDDSPVFLLGDHKGIPAFRKEFKRLKSSLIPVTIGPKTYFASHTVAIVNNELDRRGI